MLKSQDGQDIPDGGISFDVSVRTDTGTVVKSITLNHMLQGVNLEKKAGAQQSQAQLLANRLLSKGIETEEDARTRFPRIAVEDSWRIIQILGNQQQDERVRDTIERWTEEGRTISGNQISLGQSMAAALKENGFLKLADRIMDAIESDEVTEGPKAAALFAMIDKGQNLLPEDHALSAASRAKRRSTAGRNNSDEDLDEVFLEDSANVTVNEGDPF